MSNFTFGIITDGSQNERIRQVIQTINTYSNPTDEVLLVCEKDIRFDGARTIVGGQEKCGWITRKKNLIAQEAKHDNLVILHDYIKLQYPWRESWEKFGDDWDYAMNVILNADGTRYRDWLAWDDPAHGSQWHNVDTWCPEGRTFAGRPCLVPYTYNKTQYSWFSGAFFLIKKQVLLDNPFNENLCWGQGEDVELSLRLREKYKYVINPNASVKLMKQKDVIVPYAELT